jgi:hypothetical protein
VKKTESRRAVIAIDGLCSRHSDPGNLTTLLYDRASKYCRDDSSRLDGPRTILRFRFSLEQTRNVQGQLGADDSSFLWLSLRSPRSDFASLDFEVLDIVWPPFEVRKKRFGLLTARVWRALLTRIPHDRDPGRREPSSASFKAP